jgi:hypothetical protein
VITLSRSWAACWPTYASVTWVSCSGWAVHHHYLGSISLWSVKMAYSFLSIVRSSRQGSYEFPVRPVCVDCCCSVSMYSLDLSHEINLSSFDSEFVFDRCCLEFPAKVGWTNVLCFRFILRSVLSVRHVITEIHLHLQSALYFVDRNGISQVNIKTPKIKFDIKIFNQRCVVMYAQMDTVKLMGKTRLKAQWKV